MAQRFTTSITAKIFYLMTTLILVTVIGMSIQSSTKFKQYLSQSIEDGSLSQAERAASDVAATLDSLSSKISVTLPKLDLASSKNGSSDEINGLLRNDSEIVAASVFYSTAQSTKQILYAKSPYPAEGVTDNRFEGQLPDQVKVKALIASKAAIEGIVKEGGGTSATQVRSIAPETGLPIMLMVVRFDIDGKRDEKVFVTLSVWQTRLLVSLPKTRFTDTILMDQKGDIFASSDTREMIRRTNVKSSPLARTALAKAAPSGFQDVYQDRKGNDRLGAFAQVAGHPNLFVLVEKDANASFLIITRSYYSAILWAMLFTLIAIMASFLGAGTATRSIRELLAVTKEISNGNFAVRVQPQTSDEIAELGLSVNNMAGKITQLLSTQVEKARYEKELETARMVQSTFFPKQDVLLGPLSITGFYQPATECGGDLWGHYQVDKDKQLVFIADAMGHGAPAALVTAIGYATCQAVATILMDEQNLNSSPSKLLDRLNRIIYDAVEGKISMTFFAALIDFSEGTVTYSNAGHNFPVVLTNNREDDRLSKQGKAKSTAAYAIPMQLQGTPLGVDREAIFKEKTMNIKAGDRIFLFTDGLIENHLPDQQPMGRKVLLDILSKHGGGDCFQIKNQALDAATKLFGSTNLDDDVTIVVAEISKNWAPKSGANLEPNKQSVGNHILIEASLEPSHNTLDQAADGALITPQLKLPGTA